MAFFFFTLGQYKIILFVPWSVHGIGLIRFRLFVSFDFPFSNSQILTAQQKPKLSTHDILQRNNLGTNQL